MYYVCIVCVCYRNVWMVIVCSQTGIGCRLEGEGSLVRWQPAIEWVWIWTRSRMGLFFFNLKQLTQPVAFLSYNSTHSHINRIEIILGRHWSGDNWWLNLNVIFTNKSPLTTLFLILLWLIVGSMGVECYSHYIHDIRIYSALQLKYVVIGISI